MDHAGNISADAEFYAMLSLAGEKRGRGKMENIITQFFF